MKNTPNKSSQKADCKGGGDKRLRSAWPQCIHFLTPSLYLRRAELVDVNEKKQKEALKQFYENEALKQKNEDRIKQLKKFSKVINPLFCIGFVLVFWAAGMHHYYQEL